MNLVFIDTSALFKAKTILRDLIKRGYQLYISPIVIYEFIKVIDELIRIEKKKERKDLYKRLKERFPSLIRDLELKIIPHKLTYDDIDKAYSLIKEKNIDIGDALIYILMKKNGIRKILTYDKDWKRMDVDVLN